MSLKPSLCDKETLRSIASRHGVEQIAVAKAGPVDQDAVNRYRKWLSDGNNASMDYLARYDDLRADPRLLLPGATSIICCAINYFSDTPASQSEFEIAMYARGDDYHEVVRAMLDDIAAEIRDNWGGETRVCVDTAPIRERYWAMKAGLGFIGRNNHLIIPRRGSYFFLGEIITTAQFQADEPINVDCGTCHRCIDACPGNALSLDSPFDSRRCLSYMTIEHRGPLADDINIGNHIYGCDECQKACPHNSHAAATNIRRLQPRQNVISLTATQIDDMTQERFSTTFSHSAIKRTKLAGLQRNLAAIKQKRD